MLTQNADKVSPAVRAILAELRAGLEALYGERLAEVVLYGSQARGDAAPDSDIDVLIVLKGDLNRTEERRATSELIHQLCLRYDVVVSGLFMSEVRYQQGDTVLLANIRAEGVKI
jgi:predicted nucleotidyltransferase